MDYMINGALLLLLVGGIIFVIDILYRRFKGERLAKIGSIFGTAVLALMVFFLTKEFNTGMPDFKVTVDKLSQEFRKNDVAAFAKYKNKLLSVTGRHAGSGIDSGQQWILLDTSGMSTFTVQCFLRRPEAANAAKLQTGEQITLKGVVADQSDNLILNDCSVVK